MFIYRWQTNVIQCGHHPLCQPYIPILIAHLNTILLTTNRGNIGQVFCCTGTGVYAAASLGRGSYEALTFSLAEKNGWQVKTVRMILDIVMVLTGVLLGGKFGICTIVTIIISGPIIQFTASKTKKLLKK